MDKPAEISQLLSCVVEHLPTQCELWVQVLSEVVYLALEFVLCCFAYIHRVS